MAESTEQANALHTYVVHTMGGETFSIKAVRFSVDERTDRIEFFTSETEKDPNWTIFLHGVAAIRLKSEQQIRVGPRIL